MAATEGSRAQLGFADAARKSLSFLEADYSFEVVRVELTYVRYVSPVTYVEAYHGRSSFEIGINVGLLSDEFGFSVLDVEEVHGAVYGKNYRACRTRLAVAEALEELASTLRKYGHFALTADQKEHDRIRALGRSRALLRAFVSIWPHALEEFESKRFEQFVRLVACYEDCMTPAQRRRLSIARTRAGPVLNGRKDA